MRENKVGIKKKSSADSFYMRVPNTFFEIQDSSSLKLGNRALKAKLGRDSGLKVCVALSGLRDWSTFWVGITRLRTPIEDPHLYTVLNPFYT